MRNLKTIEKKVRAVLEKNEDARNDDMVLYLALCNACLKDAGAMPLAEIMTHHKNLGQPSLESVRRTRRKQQKNLTKKNKGVEGGGGGKKNALIRTLKSSRAVLSGVQSLSSVSTPTHPTLMCVGTARAAQIISGVITRMSLMLHGKS